MSDQTEPTQPPTTPTVPEGTTVDESSTTAKDRREAAKAEKELIERATFQVEPAKEIKPEENDERLFVTKPPSESPFNNDGFIGVDPTLQGPSEVRSVGPDPE